jgi:putative serine protease PepD
MPVMPATAGPGRSSGRLRVGLVGVVAGALLGGGAGAGVAALAGDEQASSVAAATGDTASAVAEPATPVAAAAAKAAPSVVTVYVDGPSSSGSGSGVVLSEDGYVLTNNHVISAAGGSGLVQVRTGDGVLHAATVVGAEPSMDLAVLQVADAEGLVPATFADSDSVRVGDLAVAIGAPLGLSETVTDGIVSAIDRPVVLGKGSGDSAVIDALQTDAAINPGNSGGALVDAAGEVIGINTAIATVGSAQTAGSIGVGFAIPSAVAERIAADIIDDGSAAIAALGVTAGTVASTDNAAVGVGAQVHEVRTDSPAHRAGLRPDDVITGIDGRAITTSVELTAAIRSSAPGDEVALQIERGGQGLELGVVLVSSSI